MCGIAGFTHRGVKEAHGVISKITKSLNHRGPDQQGVFVTPRVGLGAVRLKTGREREATEAFRWAAEQSERAFGAGHTETARCLGDLGTLLRREGNHSEAQTCLRRALDIHREAAGMDSREATEGLYQLASSLEESGDLDGAASEFERLLAL